MSRSLSVVIPLRDEEGTLAELHEALRRALPESAEIIFVDDGSRDESLGILTRIAAADPRVVVLSLARPMGKSEALAAGFARASGEVLVTLDADLQEDPADIPRLLAALRSDSEDEAGGVHDLVTGWRRERRDPAAKVAASRAFNALARWWSGVPLRDINCGLKVLRREVAESIPIEGGYHRFLPLLAHWKGFRVGEVEIGHRPRRHGRSRFGSERIVHGLVDLVVLLFLARFERRPSRFFLSAGAALFVCGLAINVFLAVLRLGTGSIQSRYPLLTLGVLLLLLGVQLVSTGLLAEIVALRHRGPSNVRATEIAPRGRGQAGAPPEANVDKEPR